ncbi:hypothetical protein GU927_013550 [Rhodobacteraceae bacterium HSP-20]|uniref:Arm DNA-binding domain-containing protein n=1 Tax=Paragemmobacter amnigenus TaxID=2852097 RepID=A0ABS6J538_9RHOB|nr:hypothetical protein [Rhodobacter amnigenus]MBU9698871.1 hypothetical protein [Rhodobacter amnigenus]MBV4390098.1 hypothetical protein [Rhodobacter amnigenus]
MTIYTGRRTISLSISEGRSRNPTYRLVLRYPEAGTSRTKSTTVAAGSRDIGCAWSGDETLTRPYLERWASDLLRLRTRSPAIDLRRRCDGTRSNAELRHTGQHRPRLGAALRLFDLDRHAVFASSGWMAA